jgi:phytoene dehydrogenase-like protein
VLTPRDLEARAENFAGGDFGAGVSDIPQLFTRPTRRQYRTPLRGPYLCSAATLPGVRVHEKRGYYAARRTLREVF